MSTAPASRQVPEDDSVPEHDRSVFINCPFGADFGPAMDAILFTIVACGYEPRSAVDTDNTADSRLQRIVSALRGSHLSVHDLSLVYGDAGSGVAHLNMPLELGIAMALKLAWEQGESTLPHTWTALVLDGSAYRAAVSDLNGHDLKRYSSREQLVAQVMAWLTTRMKGRRPAFKPVDLIAALPDCDGSLQALRDGWVGVTPPWKDLVQVCRDVAASHGLRLLAAAGG